MQVVNAPHLPVRPEWLALHDEPVLEPDRPIVDAHHHLWDRQSGRYLAHEFLADTASGHRVVSTVYVQCRSMLRVDGPVEMRPVGEVEFANGVAAMSASGAYGPTRCCEAIVGGADLSQGERVARVLEAMLQVSGGRLRGIRNPLAWHASAAVSSSPVTPPRDLMENAAFKAGVACLVRLSDAWTDHVIRDLRPRALFHGDLYAFDTCGVGEKTLALGRRAEGRDWIRHVRRVFRALSAKPRVHWTLCGQVQDARSAARRSRVSRRGTIHWRVFRVRRRRLVERGHAVVIGSGTASVPVPDCLIAWAPWTAVLALAVLAGTTQIFASAPAFYALGFSLTFAATSTNATIQRQCPEHVRGGLVGMYGMAYNGTMPFGYLLVGTASEALGVRNTFGAMAFVLAAGVLAITALHRFTKQREGAQ